MGYRGIIGKGVERRPVAESRSAIANAKRMKGMLVVRDRSTGEIRKPPRRELKRKPDAYRK